MHEQEQAVDSTERDRMRDYYWRKGIPSIVLAIVTILLALYSYWIVQPNIQNRYKSIVEGNLRDLGLIEAQQAEGTAKESPLGTERTDEERKSRRQKLEETHLCLRRQIIWNNQDDLPRYRTGLVSAALADWYLEDARRLSTDSSPGPDVVAAIRDAVSRARAERQKGMEAMRAAAKIEGPYAPLASLWMVQNQMSEKAELSLEEIASLEATVRELIQRTDASSENNSAEELNASKALLAQLLVRASLSPLSSQDARTRRDRLSECIPLIPSELLDDVTNVRWLAEAKLATQPIDAKQLAWQGTQSFWAKQNEATFSVDTIAAAFECMLLGGSLKEAQAFLAERLPGVPSFEQAELRSRSALACIRMLMATSLRQLEDTSTKDAKIPAVLSIAMQLQPDSSELISVLERTATNDTSDEVFGSLSGMVEADGEPGLRSLLNVIRYASNSETELASVDTPTADISEFENYVAKQPILGIVASKLALRQTAKQPALAERWTMILRRITVVAPDILVVWSDLASLYTIQSQTEQAIECLEYLQAKLPDNQEIGEAIERAKEKRPKP
jgi:hypothetical protein